MVLKVTQTKLLKIYQSPKGNFYNLKIFKILNFQICFGYGLEIITTKLYDISVQEK